MSPRVVVVDWASQPVGDPKLEIERAVIGDAARVEYARCDGDADFTQDILTADALIFWHNINVTAAGMARFKGQPVLIRNGVGYDSLDVDAAREHGIPVCNVPDYGTEEVADHALALALALCRQLFPLDQVAKQLGWQIPAVEKLRRLRTLTFGIIGLGRIGTAAALRAKAFGFQVVFYDPYIPNGVEKAIGVARVRTLDELLRRTDVLSIHCPLTSETRHLIAERELQLLKPSSFVVNTARGAVIKKTAILDALRQGRLAGAALDVVEDEPLQTREEATTPNLIVTCHAAFCSVESKEEMRTLSARLARSVALLEPLANVVNGVRPKYESDRGTPGAAAKSEGKR